MKSSRLTILLILAASVLAFLAENADAQVVLLGNLPAPTDNTGTQSSQSSPANQKGVSFTMPNTGYTVSSVDLRFSGYTTPPTGIDGASVGFYTDASGVPGSLVGSLLTAPSSSSGLTAQFTFTGS